ncbi:MAG TPA: universal stress protein [Halanaerobiales bacterium]|nr:universal stress protein [Halanaerobiales bacterium]
MNKILIAVDGSKRSLKAAQKASDLFKEKDAEITVISVLQEVKGTVYDVPHGTTSAMSTEKMQKLREERKEAAKEEGQKIVNKAAEYYEELGLEVTEIIKFGRPADVICDYAENNDFDMIVLSDKGHGGVRRYLLGSISDKVVRHANTSVLVMK